MYDRRVVLRVLIYQGGLLNYPDVLGALESGQLSGVGMDVFHTEPFPQDDPFLRHPKVVATPHVAGVTEISYRNMAKLVAANALRLLRGYDVEGCVN
jgi:phosphoglycerate dehydrogenase-like enzyme